ncbi:MAG: type I-U CRISPR-associated protein Cas5/Cas6 [Deltaproteobacteria bacterium]|nr:type I-U CRISPR-associated protein Cas5/Cas6 [Deltaproteobacteria bacterium]
MSLAISISFPAGRCHSTPWGHHVNEGVPEWPPSPWRLHRALVATWKRTLSTQPSVNAVLPNVLAKLTSPPLFSLPSASLGHTRHYMPWFKKGPRDRTLIFDAFIVLDPTAEVVFLWPEVTLNADEEQVLRLILSQLGYFGRAESWCAAQLSDGWKLRDDETWGRLDKTTGEVMAKINCVPLNGSRVPDGTEPVRILAADPDTWDQWSYGKKRGRPDPPWNLLAETADLHAERWSDPPGSRWLTYLRPSDAFAVKSAMNSQHGATVQRAGRRANALTVVRYALDGTVLPLVQETLSLGELARQYLQGIYGKQNEGATSALFSGKTAEGAPLQGHLHAFYLPTDEDNDGRLDHLTVYARGQVGPDGQDLGFGEAELHALDTFRRLRQVGGKPDLQLVLLGVGTSQDWTDTPLFGRSRRWRSITPFVLPRHQKTRGRKRETPVEQLQNELQRRGFPDPITGHDLSRYELDGHSIRWIEFRRERLLGRGSHGQSLGYGFVIEFAEPVVGPLCLGYGCHFGLGMFVPTER